ncbi:hypothetical protein HRbin36_02194 [bacterium HR36]|nr:hypothetical protein HRbin36_02194 [bacterium HR36]
MIGQRLHEGVADPDREVEVAKTYSVALGFDESFDVRMIHAQDTHVGAAAFAALLNVFRGRVENPHERHRPRRQATGRSHAIAFRTQSRKGKTRPASRLLNQRHQFQRVENRNHTVLDR